MSHTSRPAQTGIDGASESPVRLGIKTDADDREALADQLRDFRDDSFARWMVFAFAMAAHTHPEEIRKAIGTAFDTGAVEDSLERLTKRLDRIGEGMNDLAYRVSDGQSGIGDMESRLAVANEKIVKLEDDVAAVARWIKEEGRKLAEEQRRKIALLDQMLAKYGIKK